MQWNISIERRFCKSRCERFALYISNENALCLSGGNFKTIQNRLHSDQEPVMRIEVVLQNSRCSKTAVQVNLFTDNIGRYSTVSNSRTWFFALATRWPLILLARKLKLCPPLQNHNLLHYLYRHGFCSSLR